MDISFKSVYEHSGSEHISPVIRNRPSVGCDLKKILGGKRVTQTAFNPKTNTLMAASVGGTFTMYEVLPSLSLLHTLSIGQNAIDTVNISNTGEWVVCGSAAAGQLLVH